MNAIVRIVLLLNLLCAAARAPAQIALPPLPTPHLPVPVQVPVPPVQVPSPAPVLRDLGGVVQQAPMLSSVRTRARALLERYPGQVERDPLQRHGQRRGGALYGTIVHGGADDEGTVFQLTP